MSYHRIEVDPEKWPSNYFQSSRNCPMCKVRWPDMEWFDHCPKCDAPTEAPGNKAPTVRWPNAVKQLLHARFDNFYEDWNSQEIEDDTTN